MRSHRPPSRRGFTLLEVLVAISVFAIFSAMAYGGLIRLLDSRQRIENERAFWLDITVGFLRIQQDLALVRNRAVRDIDGSHEKLAFLGYNGNAVLIEDPRVEFTSSGITTVAAGERSDLQRIGYRFDKGKL